MRRSFWLVCVSVVVSALGTAPPGGLAAQQGTESKAEPVVRIRAERFTFTPSEVRTTVGTRLDIELKSDDTVHGFRIIGTDVNVEVPKRGKGSVRVVFTPTTPGRYTFECSHTCGAGHSFMRGVIIVEAK
ncbi:MAG: cupredoxin domain-containing protein [Acidobacteria bacterium]|nr:cupredoxin domain-containing protein [Acidobacteriota bacterium]